MSAADLILACSCVLLPALIFAQQSGTPCQLKDNAGPGTCVLFYKCSDPNRATLKICGFDRNTPVVCCPAQPARPPTRRPPHTGSGRPTSKPSVTSNVISRRVSEKKCRQYADEVTKYISAVPLQVDPSLVTHEVAQCDYSNVPFIVGGEEARLGEFPHMVALGFGAQPYEFNCGGSLISENFVLSAAHCVRYGNPVIARLGEHNLESMRDGADPVDSRISQVILHPEYQPPQKYNDIALLRLRDVISFNPHIRPACLPLSSPSADTRAVATGWGRILYAEAKSPVLLKVAVPVVDTPTCARLWSKVTQGLPRGIDPASMLCAGNLQGGKDTCQGDSGGPLSTVNSANVCVHHIVGVTSFGRYCGLPNSPGIYTRVSHFVPWIESVVWPGE